MREYPATHKDLARKLEDVEHNQLEHNSQIEQIYGYLQGLLEPTPVPYKLIGFKA